jgi:hypothetical protein
VAVVVSHASCKVHGAGFRARWLKLNINIRDMRVINCARATRSAGVLGVVENPGSGTVLEESEWTISTGRVSIYKIGVLGGR